MKFNSGKFNKIATAKNEAEERMLFSLRKHIFHERQRKKQEQEAEVEEERLREAKEMRDVMTLDKNREKLQALERSHRELQEIKQELFLKLKKLLNEDENRKKQQQKESNELAAQPRIQNVNQPWQTMPSSNPPPSSVEYSTSVHSGGPSMSGNPIYVGGSMSMNKRTRSPSPTPQHGHYYKTGGGSSGSSGGPGQPYHPPKIEEGRRVGEVSRAVLWNKPNQYATSGPGAPYYQIPNPPLDAAGRSAIIYPYSTIPSQHLRTNFVDMSQHMAGAGQKGPSQPPQQSQQQQPPAPPPGLVYDYYRNIIPMPPMGPGGVPSKDSASITRGYMKRGSND